MDGLFKPPKFVINIKKNKNQNSNIMNKILGLLAIASGTLALIIKNGGITKEDLNNLAYQESAIIAPQKPCVGPDRSADLDVIRELAQVEQTPGCSDTFTRMTGPQVPNVTSIISLG